jgi:hypothetical protein
VTPCVEASVTGFDEVLVDPVVDDVTGDDEAEVGDVQHAGVVGVAVPDLDDTQLVPFEEDPVAEFLDGGGGDGRVRDLSGQDAVPESRARPGGAVHLLDGGRRCHHLGAGEPFGDARSAEPVVAVRVGGEDVGQLPAAGPHPLRDDVRLGGGERWVDENRLVAAEDERRGDRRPGAGAPVRQEIRKGERDGLGDQDLVGRTDGVHAVAPRVPKETRAASA